MVFNPYAAGQKIYGTGSYAPTVGTVDPSGYVDRGISQSRSGLAAAALNKLQQNTTGHTQYGAAVNPQMSATAAKGTSARKPKGKGGKKNNNKDKPLHIDPKPAPKVHVTPNGQLNLPWSADNKLQAITAQQKLTSTLQGNQTMLDDYMNTYRDQKHQGNIANDEAFKQITASDAGRGMAFSSGHAENLANQDTAFTNWKTGLNNNRTAFQNQIASANTGATGDFFGKLRQLAINQGMDLEKYAGTLGYGRNVTKNPKPKNPKPGKHHHKQHHNQHHKPHHKPHHHHKQQQHHHHQQHHHKGGH